MLKTPTISLDMLKYSREVGRHGFLDEVTIICCFGSTAQKDLQLSPIQLRVGEEFDAPTQTVYNAITFTLLSDDECASGILPW